MTQVRTHALSFLTEGVASCMALEALLLGELMSPTDSQARFGGMINRSLTTQ